MTCSPMPYFGKRARRKKKKERIEGRKRDSERWNSRLPQARPDNESAFGTAEVVNIHAQSQSPLLSKLPLELRIMIYRYVLSDDVLSVELLGLEIEYFRQNLSSASSGRELTSEEREMVGDFRLRCPPAGHLMALGKCCKFAYFEVIDFIYTANTFRIPNVTAFICFQRLVSPHSFQAIRSLHMKWSYQEAGHELAFLESLPPSDPSSWEKACHLIAEMTDLKKLRVDIIVWHRGSGISGSFEALLLSPLEAAARNAQVQVYTNWEKRSHEEVKNWPFTVRRGLETVTYGDGMRRVADFVDYECVCPGKV